MEKLFASLTASERSIAIQRLTALWALNECGLGGILHAFNSPFTGLIVGSIAMICIAMICSIAEHKWQATMTALLTVLIVKALVSPHTSPTAYIAVTFQGLTGAIIYRYIPHLLFGSMFFACLGLIESAVQRLLTLTILYGNTLWEAIDLWGEWIAKQWGFILPFSSAKLVIYCYLGIYLFAGLIVGWIIYKVIRAINRLWGKSHYQLQLAQTDKKILFAQRDKKRRRWKTYFFFFALIAMIVISYTLDGHANDFQKGLLSVLRAFVILTVWFLFLAPFFIKLIRRFLEKKRGELYEQVAHAMDMMPYLAWIIDMSWKKTKQLPFITRWKTFIIFSLLSILQFKFTDDPHLNRADQKS